MKSETDITALTGFREGAESLKLELPIIGMHCPTCAVTIEKSLKTVDGVKRASVNPATEKGTVEFNPAVVSTEELIGAIKKTGYQVGASSMRIGIEGMYCASCVTKIEKALKQTPGVLNASVNLGSKEAYIDYLPEKTNMAEIKAAIEATGYKAIAAPSEEPVDKEAQAREREYKTLMRKFIFSAIVSIPVLLVSYPKFFPFLKDLSDGTLQIMWIIAGIITLPVLLWSGGHFITGAVSAFKHRSEV